MVFKGWKQSREEGSKASQKVSVIQYRGGKKRNGDEGGPRAVLCEGSIIGSSKNRYGQGSFVSFRTCTIG